MVPNLERRFWPVLHLGTKTENQRNIETAQAAGAYGVFLIDMNLVGWSRIEKAAQQIPDGLRYGINVLSVGNWSARLIATRLGADAYWTDHVESDRVDLREKPAWFGGVAHKGNAYVLDQNLQALARKASAQMAVPTTTGANTGYPPSAHRIELLRKGIPDHQRLAIASGVTPENISMYLEHATDFLVATGISTSFHRLNPERTAQLGNLINGWTGNQPPV